MLLRQFLDTYNEDNGWFGLEEDNNGYLVMCRPAKNPTARHPNDIRRFEFFNCDYCGQNAIRPVRKDRSKYIKAKVCCRYSKCYNKHVTLGTIEGKKRKGGGSSRKNPVINRNGYLSWTEYELDESGHRIKHKSSKGNIRIETFEHKVLMEEYIGRKLTSDEHAHHIDCDKLNNNIDNLWLCNKSAHMKAHWSINKLISSLIKANVIKFDKKAGKYELDITGIQSLNTMKPYVINNNL